MLLKQITEKYYEDVRKLRNSQKKYFIQQNEITPIQQKIYMSVYKNCYYVCLYKNKFAGYIGVIANDIRICVVPKFRTKGIGKFMIREIIKIYPEAYAKTKIGNQIIEDFFEECGFKIRYKIYEHTSGIGEEA